MTARTKANSSQQVLFKIMRTPKETYRHLRNYLAGQFIGATRDETLLHELVKCLFCKLYLEISEVDIPSGIGSDSFEASRFYRNVFGRVRKDFPDIFKDDEEMLLDPRNLAHVMGELAFSLTQANEDPIGDAFEVFAGSESRARSGQFFTPRNAMELLVEAVDPKPGERIIDPACGAGGFLAAVARYFRHQGLSQKDLENAAELFFGVEKDAYLAKLARLHVSLLTCGHPQIVCGDSLALRYEEGDLDSAVPISEYDVVLTNPPFGVKIVAATADTLKKFDLARRWKLDNRTGRWNPTTETRLNVPPQVLFLERCLSILRTGGRLGMVIPESVMSNKSYRYAVQYLRETSTIEAIIGMPDSLFKTSGKGGTHTKTCLVVAKKGRTDMATSTKVFMAEAKWCGKDSRAREIPHDDLPSIGQNLAKFRISNRIAPSRLGVCMDEHKLRDNVLCPRYYDPELDQELEALSISHELIRFQDLVKKGYLKLTTGDELGKLAYGTGRIPFVRTSDISNWEIKVDPKHGVSEEYYEKYKLKQNVQPNDLLLVKDGTYLIGTCAMITEYDKEMLFQSHIYKIRVCDNTLGISPFLLLAVLSSSVVQRQIKAKQFTQDIIDSLGERIHELILPIPKDKRRKEMVTKKVREAIERKIEARRLSVEATLEVLM